MVLKNSRLSVSIAVATYNGEKYIAKQLASLLSQTGRVDEVILFDDCSTDNTVNMIKRFIGDNSLEKKWKLFCNNENVGYIKNFCNALEKTACDVVFLCDQDDVWSKKKIETILSHFNDDKVLGVSSAYSLIDAEDKSITANFDFSNVNNDISYHSLFYINRFPGCCCAFRKSIIEKYLSSSDKTLPHDWELSILSAKYGKFIFFNENLVNYRIHSTNAIGIDGIGGNKAALNFRSNSEKRIAIFNEQNALYELYKDCENVSSDFALALKRYEGFLNNRRKILFDKKLLPAIANLFKFLGLKRFSNITFRGIIGDIVFALKKSAK